MAQDLTIKQKQTITPLQPTTVAEVGQLALLMSKSGIMVPAEFREQPGLCAAVIMQAQTWGVNAFAVAANAYVIKGKVGYEAKVILAAINNSKMLKNRLTFEYDGEGVDRRCIAEAHIVGQDKPAVIKTPKIKDITPKNSPLWNTDPDQQLAYYAARTWCRRHLPEALIGVFTKDELVDSPLDVDDGLDDEGNVKAFKRIAEGRGEDVSERLNIMDANEIEDAKILESEAVEPDEVEAKKTTKKTTKKAARKKAEPKAGAKPDSRNRKSDIEDQKSDKEAADEASPAASEMEPPEELFDAIIEDVEDPFEVTAYDAVLDAIVDIASGASNAIERRRLLSEAWQSAAHGVFVHEGLKRLIDIDAADKAKGGKVIVALNYVIKTGKRPDAGQEDAGAGGGKSAAMDALMLAKKDMDGAVEANDAKLLTKVYGTWLNGNEHIGANTDAKRALSSYYSKCMKDIEGQ